MRVLVTGATGFLGREVTHQLTAAGHEVVALTRGTSTVPDGSHSVHGDLTDLASVRNALAQAGPVEAVCHLAALTQARESRQHPLPYWNINTAGTLRILQALADQATPVRVILASSGAVYGTGQSGPIPEDAATAPTSPYGRSKAAAEELLSDARSRPRFRSRPPYVQPGGGQPRNARHRHHPRDSRSTSGGDRRPGRVRRQRDR